MSRTIKQPSHVISGVFVFLLLGLFAVFSTVMVLMGAKAYKGTADRAAEHNAQRIAGAYVRSMVRSDDQNGGVRVEDVDGVRKWMNDHCRACGVRRTAHCNPYDSQKCPKHGTRKPIQGPRLAKAMSTMSERYGVKFMFCHPRDTARIICELLGVAYE